MTEALKKCILGFNDEKIFNLKRKSRKSLNTIIDLVTTKISEDNKIICTYKPKLSKSDREELGYHYKKGKLYNLNYSEVPVCIFCKHYK